MSPPVALVGAGPGDPGLLTLRARQLLDEAEVIVIDALVSPELLATLPANAERIDVGKRRGAHTMEQEEINALLVRLGAEGRRTVRLKGGDPFVFGRGGEEVEALQAAGVPYVVVPGVSSALASPLLVGVPVTHRGLSASLTLFTGHELDGLIAEPERLRALGQSGHTLVVLMGLARLEELAAALIRAGRPPETPVVVVQEASTPRQRHVKGTLFDIRRIADEAGIRAPATLIIGPVAAFAWEPA